VERRRLGDLVRSGQAHAALGPALSLVPPGQRSDRGRVREELEGEPGGAEGPAREARDDDSQRREGGPDPSDLRTGQGDRGLREKRGAGRDRGEGLRRRPLFGVARIEPGPGRSEGRAARKVGGPPRGDQAEAASVSPGGRGPKPRRLRNRSNPTERKTSSIQIRDRSGILSTPPERTVVIAARIGSKGSVEQKASKKTGS